jgi:hypothetical protein
VAAAEAAEISERSPIAAERAWGMHAARGQWCAGVKSLLLAGRVSTKLAPELAPDG